MLNQSQHVHSELVLLLDLDIGGYYHENGLPVVNDCREGSPAEHVEDEALRRVLVPILVLLLHLVQELRELD